MFSNIGGKIKTLSKVIFAICAVVSFIAGLVLIMNGDEETIAIGFIVMIVGPLVSWVSSFFMYGFGELIEAVCDIEYNTRPNAPDYGVPPVSPQNQYAQPSYPGQSLYSQQNPYDSSNNYQADGQSTVAGDMDETVATMHRNS